MAEAAQPEVRLRGFPSEIGSFTIFRRSGLRIGGGRVFAPRGSPGLRPGSRESGSDFRHVLIQQVGRPDTQRLRGLPDCEERRILQAPLDSADEGAIYAHALRDRFLADARG